MNRILKYNFLIAAVFLFTSAGFAQQSAVAKSEDGPKLIVGIVVDQMRYTYLPRYWSDFEEGGFKRLVSEGFLFTNHHYNYFPTYTGPGHAAIYTGTTPSINGIVGNVWYDRSIKDYMYVVADSTVAAVGAEGEVGKMSPANLISTTVTDQLKLASPSSKVIAVSIKDRGAILPGGHLADGAFWFDGETANFITSTWYMDELPEWVQDFNESDVAEELSNKTWETLLPMNRYNESNPDKTPYEGKFDKEEAPVFPHELSDYTDDSFDIIKSSPFGNTLVKELAKKAIEARNLGADETTDFLSVSFSSTDYVGHQFGPHSVELQDTYLRLDRDLADFLNYLDQKVGKGNYLVFLTSDHGVVDVPAELMDKNLPGGYFNSDVALKELSEHLKESYGDAEWIESYINQQVYLNRELMEKRDLSLKEIQLEAAKFLRRFDGVLSTNTAFNFQYNDYTGGLQAMYQRGFMHERSGDVYIQLKPGWLDSDYPTGTSHGSPYNYDTHVPLIFYGWNIPHGKTARKTVIPQIAPTISTMLNVGLPSGSPANVLRFEE
ncbi:MAG TPA: alkaline phosphatase PafA [Balneolaceae bacterium]